MKQWKQLSSSFLFFYENLLLSISFANWSCSKKFRVEVVKKVNYHCQQNFGGNFSEVDVRVFANFVLSQRALFEDFLESTIDNNMFAECSQSFLAMFASELKTNQRFLCVLSTKMFFRTKSLELFADDVGEKNDDDKIINRLVNVNVTIDTKKSICRT